MKLPRIAYRPFVAAGLTGVMVAQAALGPVSAIAAEANGAETTDVALEEVAVDTSFSTETQRLIQAANQQVQITLDEANALLAAVQADRDKAVGADTQAQQAVDSAQQNVTAGQTAVATADAAVTAELQAQIDSLSQQLADAKANVAALEQQKSDAEGEKSDLESQKAEAEDKVDELQKALDEANAKLEEAQAALDALGEDPTADEQAAYDAAKGAYDKAVADQEAKEAELEAANATLTELSGQLAAKEGELQTASATLAEKQQATASAEAALQTARDGYTAAVEAIKGDILAGQEQALASAQGAYDSAKAAYDEACAAAEDPSAVDRSALDAAESALASAQAAYDSALETAGAQAEAEAQAQIDAAQAAYDAAVADRDACQQVIDETPAAIEAIEGQIETEQAKVDEAQQAADDADAEVDKAEAAVAEAEAKLDALAEEQDAWDKKAAPLKQAVANAETAVETAQGELDAANQKVSDLENQIAEVQKQIDDLKAQAGETQMQAVDDFCDFLVWLRKGTYSEETNSSDCSAALGYLAQACGGGWGTAASGNIEDYTHPGEATDATAIDNVLKALDMIDQLNAIRTSEGLDTLDVSLVAMVEAAYHANWSAETGTIGHASQNGYDQQWGGSWGENAAWGYTAEDGRRDFFTGWFYQEKANYTKKDVTDPNTGITYHPEEGGQTGHYTNIISSNKKYTGMAIATDMPRYGTSAVNVFGSKDLLGGRTYSDKTYTTDALRQLIAQAQDEGVVLYHFEDGSVIYDSVEPGEGDSSNQDAIDRLEAQLADLKSQLATAEQTAADKQQVYDDAVADKNAADEALAAIGKRPTDESLQQAVADAQAALEQAEAEKDAADANLTQVKAETEAELAELNGQKSDLQTKLDEANADIAGLTQAAEDALADLNQAKENNQAVIDAGEAYRTAKANAEAARAAEAEAQKTVDALSDAVAELEGEVATAQTAVDNAQAAYDAAGPTAEQTEALAKAEAALEDAKAELERLTDARDEAKGLADAAKNAAEGNDELIEKLAEQIAEQQALIDDADAKLPGAKAKADAWAAVFAQQDAESIVTDGFAGTTDDADIADALAAAHGAYETKLEELEAAKVKLEAAEEALKAAEADKEATAEDLAAAEADYAMAKEAYDKLVALMGWDEEPEQEVTGTTRPAGDRTPEQQAKLEALPTTGDPTSLAFAGMALAGVAAVAGGAHFRRRRDAE